MTENQGRPGGTSGTQDWTPGTSSGAAGSEAPTGIAARRSGRISKEIPILLFGSDCDGYVFTEDTHTVVLSQHGAGVVSRYRLIPEQELVVRWKDAGREAEVRVVGEVGKQGNFHTYGVAFLDDKLDFWRMEFPPAPHQPERPLALLLECGTCGDTVELLNGDFEYDICAIHGGLTRFCADCGMLTVWRTPQDAVPRVRKAKRVDARAPEQTLPENGAYLPGGLVDPLLQEKSAPAPVGVARPKEEAAPVPLAETVAQEERRSRTRAKVNFFACVRSDAFPEEIVTCIDMARGGVSFKSQNCHRKDSVIQIAVPFAAEEKKAPAIFVKGRIANVRFLEMEGMYRCGVEFLR